MNNRKDRVCPVERAGSLDNRLRRWLQNPHRVLKPFIEEGMTAVDFGCGPGFFSLEMARLVGASGKVFAVDIQEGMLRKLKDKIIGTELENRIMVHKADPDKLILPDPVDFVLAFYVVHEVPDQAAFFMQTAAALKMGGRMLIVEPPFHVSKSVFAKTINRAGKSGLTSVGKLKMRFNRTVVLEKS